MISLTVFLVLHPACRNPWVHTKHTWQSSRVYTSNESSQALTTTCAKCKLRPTYAHKRYRNLRFNHPQTPLTFGSGLSRMAQQIALWMINEALLPIFIRMAHLYPMFSLRRVDPAGPVLQNMLLTRGKIISHVPWTISSQ